MDTLNKMNDTASNIIYKPNETCQITNLHWLYEKYFGLIDNGTFVEVGAFDGEYVSNTSFLADLGWYGHYIEPIPDYFNKCQIRHQPNTNTQVHNMAIGNKKDTVRINVSGALSSIDQVATEKFKNLDWAKNLITDDEIEVSQITLNQFLEDKKVDQAFEILSVDVEGYELNVLKGFDIDYWKPKMVIIELHDQNHDYKEMWPKMNKIVRYMEKAEYRVIYKDFTNTVYVRTKKKKKKSPVTINLTINNA